MITFGSGFFHFSYSGLFIFGSTTSLTCKVVTQLMLENQMIHVRPHFGTVPVRALGRSSVPVSALGPSRPRIGTCDFLSC